jgi:hypothetical protein
MKRAKELLKHDPDTQKRLSSYASMPMVSKMHEISQSVPRFDADQADRKSDSINMQFLFQKIESKLDNLENIVKNISANFKSQGDAESILPERPYKRIKISKKANHSKGSICLEENESEHDEKNETMVINCESTSHKKEQFASTSLICSGCDSSYSSASSTTQRTESPPLPSISISSQIVSLKEDNVQSLLWD